MTVKLVSRAVECPVCGRKFDYYTPKASTYSLLRRDSDNCPYYKDANPVWYAVWVCPSCHFAAYKDDFLSLEEKSVASLRASLKSSTVGLAVDFNAQGRSLFAALQSYQMALKCYEVRHFPLEVLGGVALRAAWMCRYSGQLSRELIFLQQAKDYFLQAFSKGLSKGHEENDLAVAFLIGELLQRTGDFGGAQRYFMMVISNPEAKEQLSRAAKERLYESKEAIKTLQLLTTIPLLTALNDRLNLLAAYSETRSYTEGSVVCRQGDAGDSMFVIATGEVRIYLGDPASSQPVSIVKAGETVGEISLLTGEPRSATVVAGGAGKNRNPAPAQLIEIKRTTFRNILEGIPDIVDQLAAKVVKRRAQDALASSSETEASSGRAVESSEILAKIRQFLGLFQSPRPVQ